LESGDVLNADLVKSYLVTHHDVLDDFIMENVCPGELEQWLQRKRENFSSPGAPTDRMALSCIPQIQEKYIERNILGTQEAIEQSVGDSENFDLVAALHEIINVVGCAVYADGCSLYIPKYPDKELRMYTPTAGVRGYDLRACRAIGSGTTIAAYVASTSETLRFDDVISASTDSRFPEGVGHEDTPTHAVLCVPLTSPSKDLMGVMEFTRTKPNNPFDDRQLQTANAMAVWAGLMLNQFQVNKALTTQGEINHFLLNVCKIIFEDIATMDSLLQKIITYTKRLLSADRCALFLLDKVKQELYSNIFDEGEVGEDGEPVYSTSTAVRFSIQKGIAGEVARTDQVISIPDAYSDERFNREVDIITGYTSRTILCMPIRSRGEVIGVVEMVNKLNGELFTKADEQSFELFSTFCALALHYATVYADSELATAQHKVALEQLSYHALCTEEDARRLYEKPYLDPEDMPPNLESFAFYGPYSHLPALPQLFIEMMKRLCGPDCYEMDKFCRCVLTVRKNYRPVAYHNWKHGWNVAHCMYSIICRLDRNKLNISPLRVKALMWACLCHDVDHRGFNNTYFKSLEDPLAQLYTTSVMEQHHYNHTVTILQQGGHDLFQSCTRDEYRQVLDWIRHAIIATDLALFIPNQKELSMRLQDGSFDIQKPEHLERTIALCMTATDLSAVTKPWEIQVNTVDSIYNEFHFQGDVEKERGMTPIPMMDRDLTNVPRDQVGFIQFVCMPCYKTLADILPETEPLLQGVKDNMSKWQKIVDGTSTLTWRHGALQASDT